MATIANPRLPAHVLDRLRAWCTDPTRETLSGCTFQALAIYMATGAPPVDDPSILEELALPDFGFTQEELDARRLRGETTARGLAEIVLARGLLTYGEQVRLEKGASQCYWCARVQAFDEPRFSHCKRCVSITYCSVACQSQHWPRHKRVCDTAHERGEFHSNAPCRRASCGGS